MLSGRAPYAHGTLSAAANPAPPPPLSTPERPFPHATEDVVRRALAADRNDRWPDVPSFVAALRESLGDSGVGTLPERWLPLDAELTQPGNKPSLSADDADLPDPVAPRAPRRWPAAALAVTLLVAGGLGGFALWRSTHSTVQVSDDEGVLSVTVPRAWSASVRTHGWNPPGSAIGEPALSVGDGARWRTTGPGQGVFAGLLTQSRLPTTMPQHPGCQGVGAPVRESRGDASVTVTSTGCPGVIIERAVQLNASTLLWIQVRSADAATARQVLASVRTHGLV